MPTTDRHSQIAAMNLSGSVVLVGSYSHDQGDSLYFKTEENVEPVYMSTAEAELLIAALQAAVAQAKGD